MTKSHVPLANAPSRVNVPSEQVNNDTTRNKHERPICSKEMVPRKQRERIGEPSNPVEQNDNTPIKIVDQNNDNIENNTSTKTPILSYKNKICNRS